jgi:hypothetical protein
MTCCCYGGGNSTSKVEAMSQSGHGSSKPTLHKVMHSPWRVSGRWMRLVVGRGLLSCWPLLLGGDTSRTPARGGRGAQGLNCKFSFSSKVLYVKISVLSLDMILLKTKMQRLHLNYVPAIFSI